MPDAEVLKVFGGSLFQNLAAQSTSGTTDADVDVSAGYETPDLCRLTGITVPANYPVTAVSLWHPKEKSARYGDVSTFNKNADILLVYRDAYIATCSRHFLKRANWKTLLGAEILTEFLRFEPSQPETLGEIALTKFGETPDTGTTRTPQLLQYLGTLSSLSYAKSLTARLRELETDLKEEGESETISSASLLSLIGFLESDPKIVEPQIAISRGGSIIAMWRDEHHQIEIHFLPSNKAQYYAFVPNERQPNRQDYLTGATTADALAGRLRQIQALTWMCE